MRGQQSRQFQRCFQTAAELLFHARRQRSQYLGGPIQDGLRRPFSEETQRVVDQEVSRLLREAEERAVAMLNDHRDQLDWLAARLVETETVDGSVVLEVLNTKKQLIPRASASGPARPGS